MANVRKSKGSTILDPSAKDVYKKSGPITLPGSGKDVYKKSGPITLPGSGKDVSVKTPRSSQGAKYSTSKTASGSRQTKKR